MVFFYFCSRVYTTDSIDKGLLKKVLLRNIRGEDDKVIGKECFFEGLQRRSQNRTRWRERWEVGVVLNKHVRQELIRLEIRNCLKDRGQFPPFTSIYVR